MNKRTTKVENIELPVLFVSGNSSPLKPASELTTKVQNNVGKVLVNAESLASTIQSGLAILEAAKNACPNEADVRVDTMSFEIGVQATGRVGFLGSGADLQIAASFQVTFKIADAEAKS
jgi:hypothetical protein